MPTRLIKLRDDLARLQNTRKLIRWSNGGSLLVVAVVGILLAAFVADFALQMSRSQRTVLLALVIAGIYWAFRRFMRPWLQQSEELVDVALLVEQQQHIDSDLVAAIQFEQPDAARWGSTQLEAAVVSNVAELSPRLNVFAGFSLAEFQRRVSVAAAVIVTVGITWAAAPNYVNAFLTRLFLGRAFYPTSTVIEQVIVNGEVVFDGRVIDESVKLPFGQPVQFEVRVDGQLPTRAGTLRIVSLDGRIATQVDLQPVSDPQLNPQNSEATADSRSSAQGHAEGFAPADVFRGELPRLMDSVRFTAFVGDARTVPFQIEAVPLPIVDARLTVVPPAYAAAGAERTPADVKGNAKWHISVIEGSRVNLDVEALNKDLELVQLWLGADEYRLVPQNDNRRLWTLPIGGTPLAAVTRNLEYRIQVTDQQGLQLEAPIRGTVRLKPDRAPRIAVSARTSRVIPTATPPISYSVQDDFGISRVVAQIQVARENGDEIDRELEIYRATSRRPEILMKGTHRLELSPFKLAKGDELKVTFIAYDDRGDQEPQRSFSEPLLFQVTDQQGILSGLLETDQESAKQLDAIIRRELGIGEQK